MASDVSKLSDPPRRMTALPDLRQRAPASAVDVRAGFIDHADDAQGGRDALDVQAIGAVPFRQNAAHRVLLFGDLAQRIDDAAQAGLVQPQAVAHGGRDAALVGGIEVEGVRVEDLLPPPPNRIGGGDEGGGLAFGGGAG